MPVAERGGRRRVRVQLRGDVSAIWQRQFWLNVAALLQSRPEPQPDLHALLESLRASPGRLEFSHAADRPELVAIYLQVTDAAIEMTNAGLALEDGDPSREGNGSRATRR